MFVILLYLLLVSHRFDWDQFYTFFEVDLQSWFLDHVAPLWSYSFCGGSPRISDPQAFGLSPVFIVIMIFGPVLGAKILYLGLSIVGYFSLRYIICAVTNTDRLIASYLSLYYVLGYYFIWHGHVGHITFSCMHLWLAIFALSIKIFQQPKLHFGYFLLLVICIFSALTAGPYHAMAFFALPTCLILLPTLIFCDKINFQKNGIIQVISASVISILLAAPRLYAIVHHQLEFPRVLGEKIPETSSLFDSFLYVFTPTYEDKFLGIFTHDKFYGIWEYSGFSWNNITFFACLVLAIKARKITNPSIMIGSLVMATLGLLLIQGDFASFAPFSLLNKLFFHDSMRVSARFIILICLGLTLLQAAILPQLTDKQTNLLLNFQRLGILTSILIPVAFYPGYQTTDWVSRYSLKPHFPEKLQGVIWLPQDYPDDPNVHGMYRAALDGLSVLNCYNPFYFERRIQFGGKNIMKQIPYAQPFHFVKVPENTEPKQRQQCLDNSYYDSQRIHLDKSCPVNTCLFMNGISPTDPIRSSLELKNGLYCKVR